MFILKTQAFTHAEDRATQGCDPSAARGFAKEWHLLMLLFFCHSFAKPMR